MRTAHLPTSKSENFWASWGMLFKTCFWIEWLTGWYFIHKLFIFVFYIIVHGFYTHMNFHLIDFSLKSMSWIACPMMLKNFQIYWSTFYLSHNLLTVHVWYLWTDVPIFWHIKIKINFNKSEKNYRPPHILENGFCEILNIWKSIYLPQYIIYLLFQTFTQNQDKVWL